nr:uncharacterized protein LOC123771809 [Procambarus clarkii]
MATMLTSRRSALCFIFFCYCNVVVLASLGPEAGSSLSNSNDADILHPRLQERKPSLPEGSSSSMNFISPYYTREESDQEPTEDFPDEGDRVLTCIFASVPLIGGKWLMNAAQKIFSDKTLLEASLGLLEGGELIETFIDLGSRSAASRLLKAVGNCFDSVNIDYTGEPHSKPSETSIDTDNDTQNYFSNATESERAGSAGTTPLPHSRTTTSSPNLPHGRRRRWLIQQGGFGSDSLIGFNLLGLLVVGALITYLVYLLI